MTAESILYIFKFPKVCILIVAFIEELSITEFCHFFIPIILEYIDKVSPDELDEKTWEEVLKHFEAC